METNHVNSVPERLHAILDILMNHQKEIIIHMTQDSNDPAEINNVKQLLNKHLTIIVMYIESDGEYIDSTADESIRKCIKQLSIYLYPSDNRVSVYTKEWIDDIKNNVFTLSPKHIKLLKKSVEDLEDE